MSTLIDGEAALDGSTRLSPGGELPAVDSALAERRHARTLRALADVDAGRVIDDEAMRVWADALGADTGHPVPESG